MLVLLGIGRFLVEELCRNSKMYQIDTNTQTEISQTVNFSCCDTQSRIYLRMIA